MAVILAITYQKKLGLPNFSSHSCSVSLTVEIADVNAIGEETAKLYQLLQNSVDDQIQQVGFMPDATTYGMNNGTGLNGQHSNGIGHSPRPNGNGHHRQPGNGYQRQHNGNGNGEVWNCTDGQRGFILRLVNENADKLNKDDVEGIAQQMFGTGVKQLDKMQASQLIEELLERVGKQPQRSRYQRQPVRR